MITKYRANYSSAEITRVECTNETELRVWILQNGFKSRGTKRGSNISYFDTWEDAKNWMLDRAWSEQTKTYERYSSANDICRTIVEMEEPQHA